MRQNVWNEVLILIADLSFVYFRAFYELPQPCVRYSIASWQHR